MRLRFLLVLSFVIAAGCKPIERDYGYVPQERALSALTEGEDTKERILGLIGPPATVASFDDSVWIYGQTRFQTRLYNAPKEISRQIVLLEFTDDTLANITRLRLEDGKTIVLSRRVTDNNLENISFLRQLLGNLGNFRPSAPDSASRR